MIYNCWAKVHQILYGYYLTQTHAGISDADDFGDPLTIHLASGHQVSKTKSLQAQ